MNKPTKSTEEQSKTVAKRRKKPRQVLKKSDNLKGRQDYMDTFYVNGVKDESGKQIMRPLNKDEKKWLEQFYTEWLNADRRTSELYETDEQWKAIYAENNARNRCLYNQVKKTGKLTNFQFDTYDKKIMESLGDSDLELMIIHDRDLYTEEEEDKKKLIKKTQQS